MHLSRRQYKALLTMAVALRPLNVDEILRAADLWWLRDADLVAMAERGLIFGGRHKGKLFFSITETGRIALADEIDKKVGA